MINELGLFFDATGIGLYARKYTISPYEFQKCASCDTVSALCENRFYEYEVKGIKYAQIRCKTCDRLMKMNIRSKIKSKVGLKHE